VPSPTLLSAATASPRQRRTAFLVAMIVLAGLLTTVPFAQIKLARFPGAILIQNTLTFLNDTLTAAVLFGQYAVNRSRALCILAFGFLFTALMAAAHALSFPEVFSPTGLLNGGPQVTPWLYMVWHTVLPLAIIAFVLYRSDEDSDRATGATFAPILLTIAIAGSLAFASTWIITAGEDWLPTLLENGRLLPTTKVVVAVQLLLPLAALLTLAMHKNRSILDIWLMVLMFTWLCTITIVLILGSERYDAGFYVGRIFEIFMSILILLVFLSESVSLYAYNRRAAAVERRERERRLSEMEAVLVHMSRVSELGQNVSALIHEVNQPLTAITNYAAASIQLIKSSRSERLMPILQQLAEQATRAADIVRHLRDFIAHHESERRPENVPRLVQDAIRLALAGSGEPPPTIEKHYSSVASLALVDRVQIEQVIFNLVHNAIEAMTASPRRILMIGTKLTRDNMVEVSVGDTGSGLPSAIRTKLFEPFVTTKAGGLGVGLSICRVIVEAHGGQLQAEDNPGGGTVFRFTLPLSTEALFEEQGTMSARVPT
jgi:signal transduction histidine kinase